MSQMGFDGSGDEGQDVAALLATGFDHREHRLYKAAAAGALGAEGEFPPDHRMTQCLFARVVGRLNPFLSQKGPQPVAMAVQLLAVYHLNLWMHTLVDPTPASQAL